MRFGTLLALSIAGALAGCAYKAEPMSVGAYNVYSSYDTKLPGKYLLYVDGSKLNKTIKPSDFNCAAHTFPLELASGFEGSVRKTFANLLENVEPVSEPVAREDLAARGARAMIVVRGEDVNGRLRVVPGFWTAGMETDIEMDASIVVDGRRGRLLGKIVAGDGHAQGDAGVMCEGGASALTDSATQAIKETVRRLGEALTNSERVRSGV